MPTTAVSTKQTPLHARRLFAKPFAPRGKRQPELILIKPLDVVPVRLVANERTLRHITHRAAYFATPDEIAAALNVDPETFVAFTSDNEPARRAYEKGRALCRIALRKMIRDHAERDPRACVFLCVNVLEMNDPWDRSRRNAPVGKAMPEGSAEAQKIARAEELLRDLFKPNVQPNRLGSGLLHWIGEQVANTSLPNAVQHKTTERQHMTEDLKHGH